MLFLNPAKQISALDFTRLVPLSVSTCHWLLVSETLHVRGSAFLRCCCAGADLTAVPKLCSRNVVEIEAFCLC